MARHYWLCEGKYREREAEGEVKGLTEDRTETGTEAWRTKIAGYFAQLVVLAHTSMTDIKNTSVARVPRKEKLSHDLGLVSDCTIIRSWLVSLD